MGVSIQQWRASIGQWSEGKPKKCLATANSIAKKKQDVHNWFSLLVLATLLVIGCVEKNPGPSTVKETSSMPQHRDTLPKYKKRTGSVGLHGELYGPQVASLLFTKGLNKAKIFHLASNIDGAAGVFDDLVFRYMLKEQDIWKTCFIQFKHKSNDYNVQRISLKQMSGDFSLFKYFESYCEIKKNVSTDRNLKQCGPFDEFEFVIYTNAKLGSKSVVKLDYINPLSILDSRKDSGEYTTFDEESDEDIFNFFRELSQYFDLISELDILMKDGACIKEMLDKIESFEKSVSSTEISRRLNNLKPEPTKCVVEKLVKELQKCDFSLYKEFLQKVKIFQCQSNEKFLEKLIKDQLREYCQTSPKGDNSIYKIFHEGLLAWWERKGNSEWLSKHSCVWRKVKESLIEKINFKAKPELEEIQGYGIRFKQQNIKKLSNILQHSSLLNIITNSNIGSVSKLKIYQALEYIRSKNPLFMCLKSLLEQRKEILDIWPCKWNTILVLDCTRAFDTVNKGVTALLLDFLRKPSKKLVIISQNKRQKFVSQLQQKLKHVCESKKYLDECTFLDLDDKSQENILERTVHFQGTEVALKELIGSDPHENIKRNIDLHIINLLLGSKHKLNIGKKLGDLQNDYVPRFLEHQIYLNEDILRTTDNAITFAITGLNANRLKNYLPASEKICKFKNDRNKNSSCFKVIPDFTMPGYSAELGNYKKRHNVWKASKPKDVRYIILGENDPENDFRMLKEFCTQVHWVEMKNGSFLWRDSNCGIGAIRRCIDNKKHESYSLGHKLKHRDDVLLLAAEPGMGKSTFLTSMAHEMKKSNPSMWILRLNLHEHTRALEDTDFETKSFEKCKNFLWNAAHSPEQVALKLVELIFLRALEQTGNMIVLLDGFDEISPDYSCKVEKLIRVMRDEMKSKLWVSSRCSYRVKLEDIMGRFAFTLRPFTRVDQTSFLEQYWRTKILRPKRTGLRDFAQKLLTLSSRNFSDKYGQFAGIPLQAMMLGEAFTNEAEKFSSGRVINLPENFNLLVLFQKFTEKKFDIYFGEKNSMDCSKPKAKEIRMLCANKHEISALMSLFSPNQLKRLLEAGNANDLKSSIESGEEEQCGIIKEIVGKKPIFIHRCFAEYFAAKWFSKNFPRREKFISDHLFNSRYEVLRNIFDRILAEGLNLHGAVLDNSMVAVEELLKKGTDVNLADKGGRTALHLAASYNHALTRTILSAPDVDINTKDTVLKWTPLRYADRTRSWMAIDVLLQAGGHASDISLTSKRINHTEWGQAALKECAEKGHKKLLEFMLNSGTDINSFVRFRESLQERNTLLHIASFYGQVEVVRFLLERGADINICSSRNDTALHFAARENCVDIVTLLLDGGASANATNTQGYTPLHISVIFGSLEVTKILLTRSNALDKTNEMGYILLTLAAQHARLETVKFLIQNCRDVNVHVASALYAAVMKGNLDVISFLLEIGADINGGNFLRSPTPLQIAVLNRNFPVVKCLIEKGADVNLLSRDEVGASALYFAVCIGNSEIVDYLIWAGANLNICNRDGLYPLLQAVLLNKTESAISLIERGANVNITYSNQCTPLYVAVLRNNLKLTKCLVHFGANVNHREPENTTALSIAVELENMHIINFLVENNADINLRDSIGNTALHMAIGRRNLSLVHYLLQRGADVNIPNDTGHFPLDWIFACGWNFLADQLLHARSSNPALPITMFRTQHILAVKYTNIQLQEQELNE